MLDKSKLLKEIEKIKDSIFFDTSDQLVTAGQIWDKILHDDNFQSVVKDANVPWIMPSWQGNINIACKAEDISNYRVVSVDGSQIYSDRHYGTLCFLINIGIVELNYSQISNVKLNSLPFIFSESVNEISSDLVDFKRQEFELKYGLEAMTNAPDKNRALLLFDGSLIFWHLESKSNLVGQEYLGKYLGLLHQFYKNDLLVAWYVSLPKSKELVNLLRFKLLQEMRDVNSIDHLVDTQIANFFLAPFEYSTIFENHSLISQSYPSHLKPYFFYFNVGWEIVRIEIPQWIALHKEKFDTLISIIKDQCIKGAGYPVALAEAHEQAVVKGADRDFFYEFLFKLSIDQKHKFYSSQKSYKKKHVSV